MQRSAFRIWVVAAGVLAAGASTICAEPQPADLLAGAKWTPVEGKPEFQATFAVADPDAVAGLLAAPGARTSVTINGKGLAGLLPRMSYDTFQLDPKQYLIKGENVVVATVAQPKGKEGPPAPPRAQLLAYTPQMAGVKTGPVLGTIGTDFFTVTCRTNVPAAVTVTAKCVEPSGGKETSADSPRGFYHRLKVPLADGTRKFAYTLTVETGAAKNAVGPFTVNVPGAGGRPLRFVVAGDNRSNPRVWHAVTTAIEKTHPDLLIHVGDLVHYGGIDSAWDQEFFGPARSLLATVPTYAVLGNHDESSSAYFEMLYSPGEGGKHRNWSQEVAGVLFIGVDGGPRGNAAAFVGPALANSDAKFIILATHYPAYSSGSHGGDGQSRQGIMPQLAKARATAMVAGHDHTYERSEPPANQGVTCIVAGGSGAPLYQKKKPNPYSKVFASTYSFCLFEVKGDTCTMQAFDLGGKLIDQTNWKARATELRKAG